MDIFYYNRWRNVDLPDVRDCFRQLTAEEAAALRPGDPIWVDLEPYCPAGKVYGYTLAVVTKGRPHERGINIDYRAGEVRGMVQVPATPVFQLADEDRLLKLVHRHRDKILTVDPDPDAYSRFPADWQRLKHSPDNGR